MMLTVSMGSCSKPCTRMNPQGRPQPVHPQPVHPRPPSPSPPISDPPIPRPHLLAPDSPLLRPQSFPGVGLCSTSDQNSIAYRYYQPPHLPPSRTWIPVTISRARMTNHSQPQSCMASGPIKHPWTRVKLEPRPISPPPTHHHPATQVSKSPLDFFSPVCLPFGVVWGYRQSHLSQDYGPGLNLHMVSQPAYFHAIHLANRDLAGSRYPKRWSFHPGRTFYRTSAVHKGYETEG